MPRPAHKRSDSLDPATTCAGVTSNGRPCRRALAPSEDTSPAARYCYQHSDQAPSTTLGHGNATSHGAAAPSRASIDTLMERLNIDDPGVPPQKPRQKRGLLCCCFNLLTGREDLSPPARPVQTRPASKPSKPSTSKPPSGLGGQRAWIPSTLSPEATKKLLAELEKPISEADEPGYIYMFWVTPINSSRSAPPPADIGSSLFPTANLPQIHSIGDAIRAAQDYSALATNPSEREPGGVRLKIGRTNNVHRRINEWTKQCSHDLTLLRYYPYTTGSDPLDPPRAHEGITVPYVHRVERLIHLELADIRLRDLGKCTDCGKEHQEWFEIPAEKDALQWVDGSIRRWCDWAKTQEKKRTR